MTATLLERPSSHYLDAAIAALPVARDDLVALPLFDEPFRFACAADHRAAALHAVPGDVLKRERMLLLTKGHCLREQMLEICESARHQPEEADFRATSLETIREMVASGLGCTLLPALAADPARNDIATVQLANHASRRIALLWRRSYDRSDDLHRLAETIRANLPAELGQPKRQLPAIVFIQTINFTKGGSSSRLSSDHSRRMSDGHDPDDHCPAHRSRTTRTASPPARAARCCCRTMCWLKNSQCRTASACPSAWSTPRAPAPVAC